MLAQGERVGSFQTKLSHINDDAVVKSWKLLLQIMESCRGPLGKSKMIHNNIGGDVCLTSNSKRLLSRILIKLPTNKLVVAALEKHVEYYCDSGLYMGVVLLRLLTKSVECGVPRPLLVNIYEYLTKQLMEYLESTKCLCKVKMNLGDLDVIHKIIKSILLSKPACLLSNYDVEFFCKLISEVFLCTVKGQFGCEFGSVHYKVLYGRSTRESLHIHGMLLDASNIPTYAMRAIVDEGCGIIKTVCFTTSLSGDVSQLAGISIAATYDIRISDVVVQRLVSHCDKLVDFGVRLVLCQKVVHPVLKKHLQSRSVVVLDRLGLKNILAAKELTNGVLLSEFGRDVQEADLGHVTQCKHLVQEADLGHITQCKHLVLGEKSFINLTNEKSAMSTILLNHRSEEAANELQVVVDCCIQSLRLLLHQPSLLYGAGCWQSHAVLYVVKLFQSRCSSVCEYLSCTRSQLATAAEILCASMLSNHGNARGNDYYICTRSGHLYAESPQNESLPVEHPPVEHPIRCLCGAAQLLDSSQLIDCSALRLEFTRESHRSESWLSDSRAIAIARCDVIDAYLPNVSALRSAVNTAGLMLNVANVMEVSM